MALRISVDLDGLRWADLFRFVDLARNGGIGAEDQVDVITYGSDPLSVSLSARIYPPADAFAPGETDGSEASGRGGSSGAPANGSQSSNGSSFAYDPPAADRAGSAAGTHYPAFEAPGERTGQAAPGLPSFGGGYDAPPERNAAPQPNSAHYPAFDTGGDRMAAGGGQFAGFEPVFDRQGGPKESGAPAPGQIDSPYIEEFARLQEGLMRQVRRPDEVRPERG
jgi:hypothetical protein